MAPAPNGDAYTVVDMAVNVLRLFRDVFSIRLSKILIIETQRRLKDNRNKTTRDDIRKNMLWHNQVSWRPGIELKNLSILRTVPQDDGLQGPVWPLANRV